jgi:hypothetical protein
MGRWRNRAALPYLPPLVSPAPLRGQAAHLLRCRGSGRGRVAPLAPQAVALVRLYLQSAVAIGQGGRSRTIRLCAFVHPN